MFLTKQRRNRPVHIYDFFAGPGKDSTGHPGSPLIVLQELRSFYTDHSAKIAAESSVTAYFSDSDADHITNLEQLLENEKFSEECCRIDIKTGTFRDCLNTAWPVLQSSSDACLVIMDQCGMKEVTTSVVTRLAECPITDILFFISSSYIRRFSSESSVQKYFEISAEELRRSEYRAIHRYICSYFRDQLPTDISYHLAPFSIKKAANIYGLVFGTGSYRGLEKFLTACWKHDKVTGEANYAVDEDPSLWEGNLSLFPEFNVIGKFDLFRRELADFIRSNSGLDTSTGITNHDIYEFTLNKGFMPKHAHIELRKLQDEGKLSVIEVASGEHARKGAFYISWTEYRGRRTNPKVKFRMDLL